MIYGLFLATVMLTMPSSVSDETPKLVAHTVCELLETAKAHDQKEVIVESLLIGSRHGAVLAGEECHKGIYITHEAGKKDGNWPAFDKALIQKQAGLEAAPLRVTVRGIYRDRVRNGTRTIRQIELKEVLEVTFLSRPNTQ